MQTSSTEAMCDEIPEPDQFFAREIAGMEKEISPSRSGDGAKWLSTFFFEYRLSPHKNASFEV
jgi:hypothetical protein